MKKNIFKGFHMRKISLDHGGLILSRYNNDLSNLVERHTRTTSTCIHVYAMYIYYNLLKSEKLFVEEMF